MKKRPTAKKTETRPIRKQVPAPGTALPAADPTLLTSDDLYLFNEGTHFRLYNKLGAHLGTDGVRQGCYFSVWAPDASHVSVIGDFNAWNKASHPLKARQQSGIWEGFVPGVGKGALYKFFIQSRHGGYHVEKADPFAMRAEKPPRTASVVWEMDYTWRDGEWMTTRKEKQSHTAPIAIYEVHLGSWMRVPEEGNRFLSYAELGPRLAAHVKKLGFTHVEFLPVMEHPFYGSWGYQTTGYFAPTSRFGTPQDFMGLVDYLHQQGIGVILDWVPSHTPRDEHGLSFFDGTHLYEHQDVRKGFHPDWKTMVFNYGRREVQSFLVSSALFWLDRYHADAIRVDAVASMLYLDYSRKEGEWTPNEYGGRENLDALNFLRRLNVEVYKHYPDAQTIAEESTAWPMVSRPTFAGGLGFGFKWDMGWMHDALQYIGRDPIHRRFHHSELTFRQVYAHSENYVMPLSHDEVVHGKRSLLSKMPGDDWRRFANLRLLLGYMYGLPGKKLLFMGTELAQWREWSHEESLDWDLLDYPPHAGVQQWVADLNRLYRSLSALHALDCEPGGFQWVNATDADASTITFLRKGQGERDIVLVAANFTPVPRYDYKAGVSVGGAWQELLNSDAKEYGGSGAGNLGRVTAASEPSDGFSHRLRLTVPPLGIVFLKPEA
jgi:1,4-alpha-glucan branching enzyme